MKEKIVNYLASISAGGEITQLADDDSLLEAGVIDSMAMIDLIGFLESEFKIAVDEDDMIPENFDTVNAIVTYVAGKPAAAG